MLDILIQCRKQKESVNLLQKISAIDIKTFIFIDSTGSKLMIAPGKPFQVSLAYS